MGKYEIVEYSEERFDDLFSLFQSVTPNKRPPDYIFNRKNLFEWQHHGFGHQEAKTLLLYNVNDSRVVAYRGSVPGLYQIPTKRGNYRIENGTVISGWLSRSDEGLTAGQALELHYRLQNLLPVTVAMLFGNELTLPIYKLSKFNLSSALNRYVFPLDAKGYKSLCSGLINNAALSTWTRSIEMAMLGVAAESPIAPCPRELEALWTHISNAVPLFGLYRNRDYWEWRYIDCPTSQYFFWGSPDDVGIIVGRIELILQRKEFSFDVCFPLHGKKVLRIIDIIPRAKQSWLNESTNPQFQRLLLGVLLWAKEQGCWAADFQHSSKRFDHLLAGVGFGLQGAHYNPPLHSLAGLFQPFQFCPKPINLAWRVKNTEDNLCGDIENTYFVKSEGTADHPKFWPLPAG